MIQKIVHKYPNRKAPRIPVLPEQFKYSMLENYAAGPERMDLAVGLEVESVTRAGLVCSQSPFVIIGESGKGKTNTLRVLLNQAQKQGEVYLFDSSSMNLYSYQDRAGIHYVQEEDEFEDFIDDMTSLCESRKRKFKEALKKDGSLMPQQFYGQEKPVYIMIDDFDQFLTVGKSFEQRLQELMGEVADCGVGIIVTVHASKLKGFDPLSKWIKSAAHGLVLSAQGTLNIFPVRVQREYPQMGYGLLFHNGEYVKVQLPECEQENL